MKTVTTYIENLDRHKMSVVSIVFFAILLLSISLFAASKEILLGSLLLMMILAVGAYFIRKSERAVSTSVNAVSLADYGLKEIPVTDEENKAKKVCDEPNEAPRSEANVSSPIETLLEDFKDVGIGAYHKEDNLLIFRYQGGYFHASAIGASMLRIVFPRIYTFAPQYQDLMCRILNRINASYAVAKLVAVNTDGNSVLEVHGFADIYYKNTDDERQELLADVLSIFFEQQRSLLVATAIRDAEELSNGSDIPYGFQSAYKDISLN